MNWMHRLLNGEMKKFWVIVACAVLAMTFAACGPSVWTAEKWLKTQETAQPQIDMNGRWVSSESVTGDWGAGNFKQVGARFSGSLGGYEVQGVVSGKEACWAYDSGRGRVCFMAPGHTIPSFWNPEYVKLQKNALNWLLRKN